MSELENEDKQKKKWDSHLSGVKGDCPISIQYIKGVGPSKAKLFQNLGVETIEDLFYLFPKRYEDRRNLTPMAQVQIGELHTVCGTVSVQNQRKSWYTRKHVTEISLDDGTGRLFCVWFNQPYLKNYFRPGKRVVCYGKVLKYKNKLQMVSPEYEIVDESDESDQASLTLNRIVPIYPLTRGISQRYLRKIVFSCLEKYLDGIVDELPIELRNKHRLANIKRSMNGVHFPESMEEQEEATRRVSFEEFYFFQLSLNLRRLSIKQKKGQEHQISDVQALRFLNFFPFELTRAQKRAIDAIRKDMQKTSPMLRLLQGDVGSGKTIVALFGCLMAAENGKQSAFMAPTEILAKQHYEKICEFVEKDGRGKKEDGSVGAPLDCLPVGMKGIKEKGRRRALPRQYGQRPKVALLTSSLPKKERDEIVERIKEGVVDLVIGTHALISEDIQFKELSFVVVDEQHKFGVRQRAILSQKGRNPDILIMTATPIPRTLCMTLYGDLDVSVLDERPAGRGEIVTRHMLGDEAEEAYSLVREKLREGRQAYIVYPMVEESENLDLKSAEEMYQEFSKKEFRDYRVGLVHGKMKSSDSEKVMREFKNGEIQVLVATTVLEVGIDVPNATVMVIEHADRFGLAQLHQLRGRIGRGEHESLCVLVSDPTTDEAKARIEAVVESNDGFVIAEKDLEIRGPGHFFGRHQHGLNELRVVNPVKQIDVLELARKEVQGLVEKDPYLKDQEHLRLREVIQKRYPNYLRDVEAG